ncbi:MAG: hypothetical protein IJ529_03705 [Alphaproteobacteria bacterium]|nr:hypothetical protein [Alphaproteobacteria bacterium]
MRKTLFLLLFLVLGLPVLAADSTIVVLNTSRMIYHNINCQLAHKCTKNCINVTKQKAIESGTRPCKVYGG